MTKEVFPLLITAARAAILPALRGKGIQVVSSGNDLGEVVTDMDLKASDIILNGNTKLGVEGLRALYQGSFSEEDDNSDRRNVSVILFQVDPCDGTGDAVKTAGTSNVIGPTMLVSLLIRGTDGLFYPVSAMIYDVLGQHAVASDGRELVLGVPNERGRWMEVPTTRAKPEWTLGQPIRLNWRTSYPQHYAHNIFPHFLVGNNKGKVDMVPTGGAGRQALQFVRNFIQPTARDLLPSFYDLPPIDAIFNAQPDWKTWDVDPIMVMAKALGLLGQFEQATDIYGQALCANASAPTLANMHHQTGCLFAINPKMTELLAATANKLERELELPGCLLTKNY